MTLEISRRWVNGVWVTDVADESGGGGGTPDIAAVLAEGNDAAAQDITGVNTLSGDALQVGNASTYATFETGGDLNVQAAGSVNIASGGDNPNGGSSLSLYDAEGDGRIAADMFANLTLRFGTLFLSQNAAPADAELSAGRIALWFDKTNGTPKLMVKAKQADGTVVTGELALAP